MPVPDSPRRPARPVAGASPRVLLARLVWTRALAAEGVAAGDPGPSGVWQTADGDDVLQGVLVVARPDGRFDVELHLVAGWPTPPLHEVSAAIREDLRSAAGGSEVQKRLGDLSISFGDLQVPPFMRDPLGEVS